MGAGRIRPTGRSLGTPALHDPSRGKETQNYILFNHKCFNLELQPIDPIEVLVTKSCITKVVLLVKLMSVLLDTFI